MGTCYYIVDHARKEKFDLGRNAHADGLLIALPADRYVEENATLLVEPPHIARKMLMSVWAWCDERNWALEIISDADDQYSAVDEYAETGSLLYEEPEHPSDMLLMIANLVKSWRIELCAARIDLKVLIPDGDSMSSVQYYATIGDDIVEHGYYVNLSSVSFTQDEDGL